MAKKLIVLICLFLMGLNLMALDKPDRRQMDLETYHLYLARDWKKLILRGEQALEMGYDFYYLRMRLALAWFTLGRYEKARNELLMALKHIPNDDNARNYLYYADLYSGRTGEARRLLGEFTKKKRREMKMQGRSLFSGISTEAGLFSNLSLSELQEGMPTGDFVSSYYMSSMNYQNVRIGLNLDYQSNLTIALNRFDSKTIQRVFTGGNSPVFQHSSLQTSVYLRYLYHFPTSWYAGFAAHWIEGSYSVSYYQPDDFGQYQFAINQKNNYHQNYFGGFIGNHLTNLDLNLHFSRNDFWHGPYYQTGALLVFYPSGSLDYYLNVGYDRMFPGDREKNQEDAWKLLGGSKLLKGVYLEVSHIFGNLSNWADVSGYYPFNSVYPIRSRSGLNLIISGLIPHFKISLSGFIQKGEHHAEVYLPDGSIESVIQEYKSSCFFGGLSCVF